MNINIITSDSVIKDNRPKVIVNPNISKKFLGKIANYFCVVTYKKDKNKIIFYDFFNRNDSQNLFLTNSKYLPANIVAFFKVEDDVIELLNANANILENDLDEEKLLVELFKLEKERLGEKVLELEKENAEVRALLENAKNALQELSIFSTSNNLPKHKLELSFEPDEKEEIFKLKSHTDYVQYLPVSSMYVSGLKLYFDIKDYALFSSDDKLYVHLLTLDSKYTVGYWEIPFLSLDNEVILELIAPYIKEKESLLLIIRHDSDEDLHIRLSKEVFFDNLKLKKISEKGKEIVANAPISFQIYKNVHTFSLLNSPFIKKHDKVFNEFDRVYLSEDILYNSKLISNNVEFFDNAEISIEDDILITKVKNNMFLVINNVLGPLVKGVVARVKAQKGIGYIGILNLVNLEEASYIDENSLKELEKEGMFSGWKRVGNDLTTVSLFLPNYNDSYSNLALLVKNADEEEYVVNWHNFEIVLDEAK